MKSVCQSSIIIGKKWQKLGEGGRIESGRYYNILGLQKYT